MNYALTFIILRRIFKPNYNNTKRGVCQDVFGKVFRLIEFISMFFVKLVTVVGINALELVQYRGLGKDCGRGLAVFLLFGFGLNYTL